MKATHCPKCNAELPPKGRFCLDCGLDLYGEGLRRAPIPWLQIILAVIVLGVVVFLLVAPPWQKKADEEILLTKRCTSELLGLLAEKDYAGVVARFYRPDTPRLEELEEKLRAIVRGEGAPGLNIVRSQGFRDLDAAIVYVRKYEAPNVEYVARLLYDAATRPEPNPWLSPERVETFLIWYLKQAFGELSAGPDAIAVDQPRWEEGLLTVRLQYPKALKPFRGLDDPTVLRWRLLGGWGGCRSPRLALTFGAEDHLDQVLDFLKRLPAE